MFGHQEPFRGGFMTAGCHLGPFSWRNGSSGMAACGGGGARQGWSFLGLLHPKPSGLLPPSPCPESSDSGGREQTHLCQAWCAPSPAELNRIRGTPTPPGEASPLGNREATLGPARRNSHEGEESHGQGWPLHVLPQPSMLWPPAWEVKQRGVCIRLDRGGHRSEVGVLLHASGSGPYSVGWHVEALRKLPVSPRAEAWIQGTLVPAAWTPAGCLLLWPGCRAHGCVQGAPIPTAEKSVGEHSVLYAMVLLGSRSPLPRGRGWASLPQGGWSPGLPGGRWCCISIRDMPGPGPGRSAGGGAGGPGWVPSLCRQGFG
uniref:uncharacterized protein LOC118534276 n=1 Tax=Halichoerus grypus TaxID=9711 RepID=UPI001659F7EB|nr:uncharacterized protein LOC118534276 [Halichoerus grypus]